ncbi:MULTISPECIES: isopentenyl-diphosphate Delta-isomerase [Brevibacterium]|jgi:isopentenyl-diphosphate delta-isomerase|uniref:Isopentenyl-diphosphate Delta-isomerase n=1 Tax=Brevibacterium casei TaxID=33889 RepID=A0A7T4DJI2_9MICO|nr:isopentenyl-diphosphate Delta-isomerase [Brevibacterium casei]QQB15485.1 isopentenyl-diphosphate Delta-isomerase [Brevibacterium casei]
MAHPTTAAERVVLLDEAGHPAGTMLKSEVHTTETPLHLAFSCYLIDDDDRILLTRRALSKATWPGVWTNSFCGHPGPDESIEDAIARRADQELGTAVTALRLVDRDFRYRAVDAGGVVENEACPVYVARIAAPLRPSPAEVADCHWTSLADLRAAVAATPFAFSPWMVEQLSGEIAGKLRV